MSSQALCASLKLQIHLHAQTCKRPECIALSDMREFFADLDTFLWREADCEQEVPGPKVPNEAMKLLCLASHIRQALGVEDVGQAALGAVEEVEQDQQRRTQ